MSNGFGRHHSVVIPEYADRYPNHRVLIETGTGEIAENSEKMARFFDLVFTIDIDPENATFALRKFANNHKVIPVCADSGRLLPLLVPLIGKPCIFFLDAHWDHDILRRRGDRDTPVETELEIVLASPLRHVVLIDDARFFTEGDYRDPEYPPLDWVYEIAEKFDYEHELADDVIRLTPQ